MQLILLEEQVSKIIQSPKSIYSHRGTMMMETTMQNQHSNKKELVQALKFLIVEVLNQVNSCIQY